MKKIMMIGYGAMAKEVIARLPEGVEVGWILARAAHHAAIAAAFGGRVQALTHPEQCLQRPDLVLECASQQAVAEFGEAVLQRGWPLALISTGALADAALQQRLQQVCRRHHGQLIVLSGAVAGMDGLASAREGGLESVTYQASKSPASWRGSPAEQLIDLDAVSEAQVFLKARRAKRRVCSRPMPTWRPPLRSTVWGWTPPGCACRSIPPPGAIPIVCRYAATLANFTSS